MHLSDTWQRRYAMRRWIVLSILEESEKKESKDHQRYCSLTTWWASLSMASTSSKSFFASSLDSPRLSVLVMFNKKIMCLWCFIGEAKMTMDYNLIKLENTQRASSLAKEERTAARSCSRSSHSILVWSDQTFKISIFLIWSYVPPPLKSFNLRGPPYLVNRATAWTKKLETETRRSWSFSNQVSTWSRGGWQSCCIDDVGGWWCYWCWCCWCC